MNRKHIFILLPVVALMTLSGCVRSTHVRGTVVVPVETHSTTVVTRHVYPPHDPRHGYRHHYHDHELEYYSDLGAYVVIGTPGLYFYGDHYLRFINGAWEFSIDLGRPWRPALDHHVPRNLRERHLRKHHDHRRDDPPRHGHRRHHHGHDMSYDAGIGAYIVYKQPGIYFYNDRYLRYYGGRWQFTNKLNSRWYPARDKYVPSKLWSKHDRRDHRRDRRDDRRDDYRDDRRREERHDNRRDERRDDYRRDKDQRHDKPREDYRRDKDQRHDKPREDYRRDNRRDDRRDDRRRDRDDDDQHQERRYDDRRYDDGKKLQDINEKFFKGL